MAKPVSAPAALDNAAPITWLRGEINKIVQDGAGDAATALATTISPLVAIAFGIYIIMICINYMRGAETEPVIDFAVRCIGFAVIIGLGLNAATYTSTIIPIVTGIGSEIASAMSGGNVNAGTLDVLATHYTDIIYKGQESAQATAKSENYIVGLGVMLLYFIKVVIILIGLVPFLVTATLCLITADVGSVMVAMVGPLFFAFLIFPATRQYFSSWVNTALSYALIPIFIAVITTIAMGLSKAMLSTNGTLDKVSLISVFFAAIGNLILLFLLKQVSALASSLSAGGINASMPGSVGTLASGISAAMKRDKGKGKDKGKDDDKKGGPKSLKQRLANLFNKIRNAG
ncbi:type IV secretion system protein (plasmid) [Verminephrobacter aporrectodeae subsp. tuberculatae]|uniref:type IV secretion system protein n=1 Tax=Verminephrobacter aporrectodeae TaxID=1110389 RepID=UPI002238C865|nr:type IV secretion system protein [Verminephrobacter aporrectodeae]MCW5223647.1 type IV secretion system protein [Verminephrobacter aporrectodeae subsp. tuberculatae]MCW5291489.1 type IV secretion system protein [Verminephrobacter aporrectodeae subsp. tuberculatae]